MHAGACYIYQLIIKQYSACHLAAFTQTAWESTTLGAGNSCNDYYSKQYQTTPKQMHVKIQVLK